MKRIFFFIVTLASLLPAISKTLEAMPMYNSKSVKKEILPSFNNLQAEHTKFDIELTEIEDYDLGNSEKVKSTQKTSFFNSNLFQTGSFAPRSSSHNFSNNIHSSGFFFHFYHTSFISLMVLRL